MRFDSGEVRSRDKEGWATMAYLSATWADSRGTIVAEVQQRHDNHRGTTITKVPLSIRKRVGGILFGDNF